MKKLSLFVIISCYSILSFAQGYKIKLEIANLKEADLQLAFYYEDKPRIAQTSKTDEKGVAIFEGKEPLPGGLYMVVLGKNMYFDILLSDDQEFKIKTDTSNIVGSMKIEGSDENKIFYEYQNHIVQKKKEYENLTKKLEQAPPDSVAIKAEIKKIENEMADYWKEIAAKKPDSFLSSLLNASNGTETQGADNDHFFDNINFSDERLLRTPFIHRTARLVLARNLNSNQPVEVINREIDKLATKAKANKEVYKYVVTHFLSFFNTFQRAGMNEVFVHIAETYFLDNKADWLGEKELEEISIRNKEMKQSMIGEPAPEFKMETFEGTPIELKNIDTKYILLFFWSPGCGHCEGAAKKIGEFYNSEPNLNIEVMAVCNKNDSAECKKFIEKYNIQNFLNGYDPEQKYILPYYVVSTPLLYFIDDKRNIAAKRFGDSPIEQLIDQLETQKEKFLK